MWRLFLFRYTFDLSATLSFYQIDSMRSIILGLLFLFAPQMFGQGLNYSAPRQTLRMDAGMTVYSDIDYKIGGYVNTSYEYAFLEHVAAEAYLNTSIYHPSEYVSSHASRWGLGMNVVGRLFGIKAPYDVKIYGGARYGSHFSTTLVDNNGIIEARNGVRRSGFSPVFGCGYDHRLGDWLLAVDFNLALETDNQTFTTLAIGAGYRF